MRDEILEKSSLFFTVKQVAERLQLSLSMVYALIAKGDLLCHEFGSCKRIRSDDLESFLALNRKEAPKKLRRQGRHF
ncbi:MAG: helix-turn-helix domain-containing protein [Planctomycetota bacterium]